MFTEPVIMKERRVLYELHFLLFFMKRSHHLYLAMTYKLATTLRPDHDITKIKQVEHMKFGKV